MLLYRSVCKAIALLADELPRLQSMISVAAKEGTVTGRTCSLAVSK